MGHEQSTQRVSPSPSSPLSPALVSPILTSPTLASSQHKIAVITFNAGGVAYCGLGINVLNCYPPDHVAVWARFAREADVIAIGLQETNVNVRGDGQLDAFERSIGTFGLNRGWTRVVDRALKGFGGSEYIRSLRLTVFVATSVYSLPANSSTGVGICGSTVIPDVIARASKAKGYVWARFTLNKIAAGEMPLKLFLATAHLPFQSQGKDYKAGLADRTLCFKELYKQASGTDSDLKLLFGDLNFRAGQAQFWESPTTLPKGLRHTFDSREPKGTLIPSELNDLYEMDELKSLLAPKEAPLANLEDAMGSVWTIYPTCKLRVNRGKACETDADPDRPHSGYLDFDCFKMKQGKRIPSWCDRILYADSPGTKTKLATLRRIDVGNQRLSDHASVLALFAVTRDPV